MPWRFPIHLDRSADPKHAAMKLAGLPRCLLRYDDEWWLAFTSVRLDPEWCLAIAYTRRGYLAPSWLDLLPAATPPISTHEKLYVVRAHVNGCQLHRTELERRITRGQRIIDTSSDNL